VTLGLDTSVVVRLLIGEPAAQAEVARALLDDPGVEATVSDLVVGETYFALRHHYQVPHAQAVAAIRAMLADRRVHATGVAPLVLEDLWLRDQPPGLMDRLIHGDYQADGVSTVTFDRAAARLADARLLRAVQ
jgi:predicted nucleic acid-binding protein